MLTQATTLLITCNDDTEMKIVQKLFTSHTRDGKSVDVGMGGRCNENKTKS